MPKSQLFSNHALDSAHRLGGQSKVIAVHRDEDRRLKSTLVLPWASHSSLPLYFVAPHLLCLLFHWALWAGPEGQVYYFFQVRWQSSKCRKEAILSDLWPIDKTTEGNHWVSREVLDKTMNCLGSFRFKIVFSASLGKLFIIARVIYLWSRACLELFIRSSLMVSPFHPQNIAILFSPATCFLRAIRPFPRGLELLFQIFSEDSQYCI